VVPATEIVFYCDEHGHAPVLDWLDGIRKSDPRGWAKCFARIEDLAERGHDLDRPHASVLEDGIYELRIRHIKTQYRILYFFYQRLTAVLVVGLTKKGDKVPPADIALAKARRREFESDPEGHTWEGED
jgi:phage-related protein